MARMPRRPFEVLALTVSALTAAVILSHPLATSDGPAHVAFANLIATLGQPGHELQQRAYALNFRPNPNLLMYLVMAGLLHVLPAGLTESIVQVFCILGPAAAAWLAIRQINRENAWLAVFVLPLSLNQLFFYGMYNQCAATGAFFLVLAAYFWLVSAPSWRRAVVLAGALVLTFVCHASGFIMAMIGLTAMAGVSLVWTPREPSNRYVFLAMVAPLPLAVLFLAGAPGAGVEFGPSVPTRLYQMATLSVLRVNLRSDGYVAAGLSLVLAGAAMAAAAAVIFRGKLVRYQAGGLAAFLVALSFPDSAGGGWTHFRRFELYPFFWSLLLVASLPLWARVQRGLVAFGVFAALLLVASAVYRQSLIRAELAPLVEIDRRLGRDCTVLPLMLDAATMGRGYPNYEAMSQPVSRFELHDDRVVLFNYLARLDIYPVRFRAGVEPQSNLFHWPSGRHESTIETVDVAGFERSSGLHVDYVLVAGDVDRETERLRSEIQNALAGAATVYSAPGDRMKLYRRPGGDLCRDSVER
jgi:hypothetical protein